MGSRTHGVRANDGGRDKPLTPRDRRRYHWLVARIIAAGVLLVLFFR